jgi:predicted PurR-regulated permease PerM
MEPLFALFRQGEHWRKRRLRRPRVKHEAMARTPLIAFLAATGTVTVAALVIMQPHLPAIVTALLGAAVSLYLARRVRLRSDIVAAAFFLALGLMFVAVFVFVVDLSTTNGFH